MFRRLCDLLVNQRVRDGIAWRQISEALGLGTIKSRQWSIQETSATKGKGLFEGFDWYGATAQYWGPGGRACSVGSVSAHRYPVCRRRTCA